MKQAGAWTPFVWCGHPTSNRRDAGEAAAVRPFRGAKMNPTIPRRTRCTSCIRMNTSWWSISPAALSVPGRAPENKDSLMTRIQANHPAAESVHRLDMATSGVIVVALNKAAERELKRQFREREPKKILYRPRLGAYGA